MDELYWYREALRIFPIFALVTNGANWAVYMCRRARSRRENGDVEIPTRKGFRTLRRWVVGSLFAILGATSVVNLLLSGRWLLLAGVIECCVVMLWLATFVALMVTPWGKWFSTEYMRYVRWRWYATRTCLVIGSVMGIWALVRPLCVLLSALQDPNM